MQERSNIQCIVPESGDANLNVVWGEDEGTSTSNVNAGLSYSLTVGCDRCQRVVRVHERLK